MKTAAPPTVNAKLLKELQRWASADKARDRLRRVWVSGGWLYATDSFRAARAKAPEGAPDGVAIDREVVERMTARDLLVELMPDGVKLGRAVFPYVPMEGPLDISAVFERSGEPGALYIDPAFLKDVASMAKAVGALPEVECRRRLHARASGPFGEVEMVVMPKVREVGRYGE